MVGEYFWARGDMVRTRFPWWWPTSFTVVAALAMTATLLLHAELVAAEGAEDDDDGPIISLCLTEHQAVWSPNADKYGDWTESKQWLYKRGVPGFAEWAQVEGNLMDPSNDDDDDAGVDAMATLDSEVDIGAVLMHNGGVSITSDAAGIMNFYKNWSSSTTWCNATRSDVTQFPTVSPAPSPVPSTEPTASPTTSHAPSSVPASEPTALPTFLPTLEPSPQPTGLPSLEPTSAPSLQPTAPPTPGPTLGPSALPSLWPTTLPTLIPTLEPTPTPTLAPSGLPSDTPTQPPTSQPSYTPEPTREPTAQPTLEPTLEPTASPTIEPTAAPTSGPTLEPTALPTLEPSLLPSLEPTASPTFHPTALPSLEPSPLPTIPPSFLPTRLPTPQPFPSPTFEPTGTPAPTVSGAARLKMQVSYRADSAPTTGDSAKLKGALVKQLGVDSNEIKGWALTYVVEASRRRLVGPGQEQREYEEAMHFPSKPRGAHLHDRFVGERREVAGDADRQRRLSDSSLSYIWTSDFTIVAVMVNTTGTEYAASVANALNSSSLAATLATSLRSCHVVSSKPSKTSLSQRRRATPRRAPAR